MKIWKGDVADVFMWFIWDWESELLTTSGLSRGSLQCRAWSSDSEAQNEFSFNSCQRTSPTGQESGLITIPATVCDCHTQPIAHSLFAQIDSSYRSTSTPVTAWRRCVTAAHSADSSRWALFGVFTSKCSTKNFYADFSSDSHGDFNGDSHWDSNADSLQ